MTTACGIYYSWMNEKSDLLETVTGVTTIEVETDKSGYINIIAELPGSNDYLSRIPYDPVIVSEFGGARRHWIGRFIFIGVGVLLLLAIIVAFIFYKRYQRTKRRLEYEMTDVRNVAGIEIGAMPKAKVAKNYDPLNEEK